ncbi:hypothetical protein K438DRAFT_1826873 [Mycena galopus ATCC 62051]|nr:hypothetical protein K438DRAFT_1826873 [Mycena galopus ATCC 62051]
MVCRVGGRWVILDADRPIAVLLKDAGIISFSSDHDIAMALASGPEPDNVQRIRTFITAATGTSYLDHARYHENHTESQKLRWPGIPALSFMNARRYEPGSWQQPGLCVVTRYTGKPV